MSAYSIGKRILLALMFVSLAACTAAQRDEGVMPAGEFYEQGHSQLLEKDLAAAANTLSEMETHYPLNMETANLHMELLKAEYTDGNSDAVVRLAQRFANKFPSHPEIDFAFYAAGMANYERGIEMLNPAEGEADPQYAKAALNSFNSLTRCCPNSEYAFAADEKMIHLMSVVALYELGQMEQEYRAGQEEAATDRGWYIVSNYPDTAAAKRALALLSGEASVDVETAATEPQPSAQEMQPMEQAPEVEGAEQDQISRLEPQQQPAQQPQSAPPIDQQTAEAAEPGMAQEQAPQPEQGIAMTMPTEAQGTGQYAIQIASSKQPDLLMHEVQQALGSERGKVLQALPHRVDGELWVSAYYGVYPDSASAMEDLQALKSRLGREDIWITKIPEPAQPTPEEMTQMAQGEGGYAIQVASYRDLEALKQAVNRMGLDTQVQLHSREIDGRLYFNALLGNYGSVMAAQEDLQRLREATGSEDLWVRRIALSQPVDSAQ